MGGVDVLPLVEGGKGVAISNGASSGAWAAAGGVGTFSAVNADSYDEQGRVIRQIYHGKTRRERHDELVAYGFDLEDKLEILALNKIDALDPEARADKAAELEAAAGKAPMLVSGVSREGVTAVLRAAMGAIREQRAAEARIQPGDAAAPAPWTPSS